MWNAFVGGRITHFVSANAEAFIFMRAHTIDATAKHCAATRLRRRGIERCAIFNCFVDACLIQRCTCVIFVFNEIIKAFAVVGRGTISILTIALCAIASWFVNVKTAITFHTLPLIQATAFVAYFSAILATMAVMRPIFIVHHVILLAFASIRLHTFAIIALNIANRFAYI